MKQISYWRKAMLLLAAGCTFSAVYSQHTFTLGAEYRPRAEVRSGYSQPLAEGLSPDLLMLQRVRLNAAYGSKWVNARLSLQDARVFGQADRNGVKIGDGGNAPFAVYEAWAELLLPKGVSFRIGRQALKYDDERLLSVCNWNNTGSAHDLALLRWRFRDFKADAGYAYNNSQTSPLTADYDYGSNSFYRTMAYLWMSQDFGKSGWNVTALAAVTGFQETKDGSNGKPSFANHYKYTYGGNVQFKREDVPFGLYATAYGQAGETNKGVDLRAYMLALKLNYRVAKPFALTAGADFFSGTSAATPGGTSHTFTGLYGTSHRFNGSMDYWTMSTMPKGGLLDMFVSADAKVGKKVTLTGAFHTFRLAREMEGLQGKGLGHEIDLDVDYRFCPFATIEAGWSCYLTSDLTNAVRGVTGIDAPTKDTATRFAQWAYVSLTITPEFLNLKF